MASDGDWALFRNLKSILAEGPRATAASLFGLLEKTMRSRVQTSVRSITGAKLILSLVQPLASRLSLGEAWKQCMYQIDTLGACEGK